MAVAHCILQAKGGVGKSMIASFMHQALAAVGKTVVSYDTYPENPTFSSYQELGAIQVKIKDGDAIDKGAFDSLFEAICGLPADTHVVVDSGSTSFGALSGYIKENRAFEFLREQNNIVYLHTVVTGGQAIVDTTTSLQRLAVNFPDIPIVVWLNPYFGKIVMDGKQFEDFTVYRNHGSQFDSLIKIPETDELLSRNLADLYAKRMTFDAGMNASSTGLMARNRISRFWTQLVDLFRNSGFAV
jgi:hypothetical protein